MRGILIAIAPFLVWFLAITELGLEAFSILKARRTLNVLSAMACFGLAVDALIQAFGAVIGEGAFLHNLSQLRYILHGILVPLLIPIAFYTYGVSGKLIKKVIWIVTGAVIAAGIVMGFMTKTEPVFFAGVLRYAQSAETPAFAKTVNAILSFGGVIPLIAVGLAHLLKHKSPFLMLAGLSMFVFSALGPATGNMDLNFLLTMVGEDIMVFFFGFELMRAGRVETPGGGDMSEEKGQDETLVCPDRALQPFHSGMRLPGTAVP